MENTRDFDNLGTMVFFHKRYILGDRHNMTPMEAMIKSQSKQYISLPVYLYDHGGLEISTKEFTCPWDSGQLGFIMVHKKKAREWLSVKRITSAVEAQIIEILQAEVEEYNEYLNN